MSTTSTNSNEEKLFSKIENKTFDFKESKHFPKTVITPDLALILLSLNTKNFRQKDFSKIQKYAEEMKKGQWLYNGDSILINTDGVLVNGQHRLEAIVAANLAQEYNVETGLEVGVEHTIDIHKIRLISNYLEHLGVYSPKLAAPVLRVLYSHLVVNNIAQYIGSSPNISIPTIVDFIGKLGQTEMDKINNCLKFAEDFSKNGTNKWGNKVQIAVFKYIYERFENKNKVEEFLSRLKSGSMIDSTGATSPIYHAKNEIERVSQKTDSKGRYSSFVKAALLTKALNYYIGEKSITKLTFKWKYKEGQTAREIFPFVPGGGTMS